MFLDSYCKDKSGEVEELRKNVVYLKNTLEIKNAIIEEKAKEAKDEEIKHQREMEDLIHEQSLRDKQHDFDITHFESTEIKKLNDLLVDKDQKIAVFEKESKMYEKMIGWNADIVDVKQLVTDLIAKLPNVDLKNLTINTTAK